MHSSVIHRQPIKCGQSIRLTHLQTSRNLHSHHFQSPLSHNLEVSAFGEDGEGDEGITLQYTVILTAMMMFNNRQFSDERFFLTKTE